MRRRKKKVPTTAQEQGKEDQLQGRPTAYRPIFSTWASPYHRDSFSRNTNMRRRRRRTRWS